MRVIFPYIAQPHQTLHSLPIALEMARLYPEVDVHIACLHQPHLDYVHELMNYYPESRPVTELLTLPRAIRASIPRYGYTVPTKLLALFLNKKYFSTFQAVVVPERTSLYLRRMGLRTPRLIWTRHGAGDRAIGFAGDVHQFDFVLMAGRKHERRLLAEGLIRPGRYKTGVYAKFDIIRKIPQGEAPLFPNDRPTVVYNPHYKRQFSSWYKMGFDILDLFARQDRYNLIFAPHYRIFDPPTARKKDLFERYNHLPHMLVDLGSTRSIDMTYTRRADLYLGDVSSQAAEFVVRPRPCVFLNAHRAAWQGNPDYQFWTLGQVTDSTTNLLATIDRAFVMQKSFLQQQKEYIRDTFDLHDAPTAPVGAKAIIDYLQSSV